MTEYVIEIDAAEDMSKADLELLLAPSYVYWAGSLSYPIRVIPTRTYTHDGVEYNLNEEIRGWRVSAFGVVTWECDDKDKVVGFISSTKGYLVL